jgi:hypothetical protein
MHPYMILSVNIDANLKYLGKKKPLTIKFRNNRNAVVRITIASRLCNIT